jgi:hypothetical protein
MVVLYLCDAAIMFKLSNGQAQVCNAQKQCCIPAPVQEEKGYKKCGDFIFWTLVAVLLSLGCVTIVCAHLL